MKWKYTVFEWNGKVVRHFASVQPSSVWQGDNDYWLQLVNLPDLKVFASKNSTQIVFFWRQP